MMDAQKFCLKWDGFQSSVTSVFDHLRQDEELVDITLCCEGQQVRAHRMMLSACSPYFRDLLKNNPCQQMVFFLKDTSAADLRAIIEFMYKGSVNVAQSQLASFIKTAEMLQIRGLSGDDDKPPPSPEERRPPSVPPAARDVRPRSPRLPPPPPKRRRTSGPDAAGRGSPVAAAPQAVAARLQPASPAAFGNFAARPEPAPRPATPPAANHAALAPAARPASQPPGEHPPPLPLVGGGGGGQPPPEPPSRPADDAIKVEKVDLTDDDDVTLDATLGYVAEYEGSYGDPDLSVGSMADAAAAMGGAVAGPSQRGPADDGSTPEGEDHRCEVCGKPFKNPRSLINHRQLHEGRTVCPICGGVYSTAYSLRTHLLSHHRMSPMDVSRIVPSRRATPR